MLTSTPTGREKETRDKQACHGVMGLLRPGPQASEPRPALGRAAGGPCEHSLLGSVRLTWDVLGPADDDHELLVCQVTESGQGLDVALRHAGGRPGIELVWLSHQQVGDDLGHCGDQRREVNGWNEERGWGGGRDGSGRQVRY